MHRKYLNYNTQALIILVILLSIPINGLAEGPKNIIFYIGDGMSSVQRRTTELVHNNTLAMNTLPFVGLYTTDSLNSAITDSAAATTAMATGYKTNNNVIGMSASGKIVYESIAEAAKRLGKSIGIISTTRLTHATPACFGAHIKSRNRENKIAEQYLDKDFDVWMGGGWRHFVPKSVEKSKRKDNRNLLKEFAAKGYNVIRTREELFSINIDNGTKLFGVFHNSDMPYYLDLDDKYYEGNIPSLSEMTKVALSVLKQNPEGFFLMVEGGRIDHACHANDPAGAIGDVVDLDSAVKLGIELSKEDPDTLILVGGDHETGGMAMGISGMKGNTGYFMKPEYIKTVKRSVAFMCSIALPDNPKNVKALFIELSGISDLNEEETKRIENTINKLRNGGESLNNSHLMQYRPIFANIISKRAGIGWTSNTHTGQPMLITAGGAGAEYFTGYYDNTDIAKKVAALWGVTLKKWLVE